MPSKKKSVSSDSVKILEAQLWDAANKMRGAVLPTCYMNIWLDVGSYGGSRTLSKKSKWNCVSRNMRMLSRFSRHEPNPEGQCLVRMNPANPPFKYFITTLYYSEFLASKAEMFDLTGAQNNLAFYGRCNGYDTSSADNFKHALILQITPTRRTKKKSDSGNTNNTIFFHTQAA